MRKILCVILLMFVGCMLLYAASVGSRAGYRHVRTNKTAWVRSARCDTIASSEAPDIYVSTDSLLIVFKPPFDQIDITIADHLHEGETPVFTHYYGMIDEELRIPIDDIVEGVYKITICDRIEGGYVFGYFAKGEQYEQEVEALWETNAFPLMCTEVCVANIDQTIDYSNNYGSWIELYNPSTDDVPVNGWYISDEADNLMKHRLTGYDKIKSGSYMCVFFDHNAADGEYGTTADRQVRFKLNRKGGSLYLSRDGKNAELTIVYPASVPRCSWARMNLNADEWQYCGKPSPAEPNAAQNTVYYADESLPTPEIDQDSHLFTSEFDVQVQIPSETTLRYTTDGSTPTLTNGLTSADGLFHIAKTTVLRLRLFAEGWLPSGVVTRTFIYKDRNYYLPIVAITTDPRNLYDNQIGCYVDGTNGASGRGASGKSNLNMDWERPVNFEYLTADGQMVINQESCFEVAGGWSRHFKPASFKVKAKKLYDGNGKYGYPVFAGKPYQEYKQLLIRNGGNNNRTDGGPRIKDGITQQVLTTTDFYVDAQEFQPVHVFINGKYLAMMNVREPSNRFHGTANYGYDDDQMDAFEYSSGTYQQKGGTREAFDRMIQASYEADTEEGYARLSKLLDIDEFAHYMATVCYTGTSDWVLNSNNVKGYRSRHDGRFHFVFFDQDLTWEQTNNVEQLDNNEIICLYRNLKENATFRRKFVTAYCILHSSIYTPERCQFIADSICALVGEALSFDGRSTTATYRKLQQTMWEGSHREARIWSLMKSYSLSDRLNVDLGANCSSARIQIDGMEVPCGKFSGVLFAPVTISTSAAEGYTFLGWRDQSGRWVSHDSEFGVVQDGSYTAVYEWADAADVSPICINEISVANNTYINDYSKRADWIELYNRGQEAVDVAGWLFGISESEHPSQALDIPDGVSTVIAPGGHLIIWCDGKSALTEFHLPFKLKNADGSFLALQSPDGRWRDTIRYSTQSPEETVGRYPDGGKDCWTFYHPTIGRHNIRTSYDQASHATPSAIYSPVQTGEVESTCYYTISGIKVLHPTEGIYIEEVRYKNGNVLHRKVSIR